MEKDQREGGKVRGRMTRKERRAWMRRRWRSEWGPGVGSQRGSKREREGDGKKRS